jgi:hypothetical protein
MAEMDFTDGEIETEPRVTSVVFLGPVAGTVDRPDPDGDAPA